MCPFHYVVHHTSIFSTSCLQIHVPWAARKNSGIFQCTLSGLPYPHLRVPGTDLGFRLVPGSSSCGAAWPQLRGPISPLIKVFAQAFTQFFTVNKAPPLSLPSHCSSRQWEMAPHKSRGSHHIKCAFRFPIPWLDAVVEKMFQRERESGPHTHGGNELVIIGKRLWIWV